MDYQTVLNALKNVNGSSFVGIDTVVDVKLSGGKKNPQQGRITKKMVGASVMVFQNKKINGYEAMVQRRLAAEGKDPGSFELGERAWGTRLPDLPIVEHIKDGVTKHYLEVIFLKSGKVEYFQDGAPINEADITGLPDRQVDGQGGLDNAVIIRTFGVDSLTAIRVDGNEYT